MNNGAAQILYDKVGEFLLDGISEEESRDSLLLDLCSGTGTIGQLLSAKFSEIVGIELVKEAVEQANETCVVNNIKNAEFICGKVEEVLPSVMKSKVSEGRKVMAVLDPPRAGVHKSLIPHIRGCEELKRLVFVACDIGLSGESNLFHLCRPEGADHRGKSYIKGRPFVVKKAIAVDLFPHSKHGEYVLLLERSAEAE